MSSARIGLVLSSGGGKGAYQVGAVRRLAELGLSPCAIAGTSVGALNGAILASAPSFDKGVQSLETVWDRLAASDSAELSTSGMLPGLVLGFYLTLLMASGNEPSIERVKHLARKLAPMVAKNPLAPPAVANLVARFVDMFEVTRDEGLAKLVRQHNDPRAFDSGLPLYVGVFRSQGQLIDIAMAAAGWARFVETPDAEFLHVQALPHVDRQAAILASAAVPVLFQGQSILGQDYVDGAIGGWLREQGSIPAAPLVDAEMCDTIIVVHANDGSMWDRKAFQKTFPRVEEVWEIRPQEGLERQGYLRDLLSFDHEALSAWRRQGYHDAGQCIEKIQEVKTIISGRAEAENSRNEAIRRLIEK